jgi:hypothetical protein
MVLGQMKATSAPGFEAGLSLQALMVAQTPPHFELGSPGVQP